ncbi:MAG: ribosome-binding factor A [Phycisphaerales bacterium]|nr:ribosome-binding factor A [Phycisphaerales bacterium]
MPERPGREARARGGRRTRGPVLPPGIHVPGLGADPAAQVAVARRAAQVGAVLHRALQQRIARGLSDPRLQGLVSILEVHVTPDLSQARVRVSVLPADRGPLSLSALRSAAGHLRASVRDSVDLRRVPELSFELAAPREETPE